MPEKSELMKILSEEITKISELVYTFRTKIAFVAWIGPFVVLSSYLVAVGGKITFEQVNIFPLVVIIGMVVACYIGIGYISAKIEVQAWRYCNKLRGIIANLSADEKYNITVKEYRDDIADRNDFPKNHAFPALKMSVAYMVLYLLMILSAILLAVLIVIING